MIFLPEFCIGQGGTRDEEEEDGIQENEPAHHRQSCQKKVVKSTVDQNVVFGFKKTCLYQRLEERQ